jgi:hypothetical protein
VCQAFGARRLEQAVEEHLLECLSPLGVEAMAEAAKLYTQANDAERERWTQQVERARYEVDLARRQYDAVDPDNRLVARELERRFESALKALADVEAEANDKLQALQEPLSQAEQEQLRRYARDLQTLWRAPTTRAQDRKRIARCLIDSVVVAAPRGNPTLNAEVYWQGGDITQIELPRGKSGVHRYVADAELVELVRTLACEFSDDQIARVLRRKRLCTPKGLAFMPYHVTNLRRQYDIVAGPRVPRKGKDVYTAEEAAELFGVSRCTVIRWVEVGLLRGSQLTPGAPWRILVTDADVERLSPTEVGEGWATLKRAAAALEVSQQTVLQKLKRGELEGVRVQNGRRSSWRIRLPQATYDDQPSLFATSQSEV